MAKMKHIVSFSGGKDSTAMLLRMMELKYPIDEVINVDTGLEFPLMYEHINKIREIVEKAGIKFTVIKADKSFEWYLLEFPYHSKKKNVTYKGYGWTRGRARWCTAFLKILPVRKYFKENFKDEKLVQYIGIASDEQYRLERKSNQSGNHRHPLVDWGWKESDALKYCYDRGFDWGGLYEHFSRVSCWCCPLQPLSELRTLYIHFPHLWENLKNLEAQGDTTFRQGVSLPMLEARFVLEREREGGINY